MCSTLVLVGAAAASPGLSPTCILPWTMMVKLWPVCRQVRLPSGAWMVIDLELAASATRPIPLDYMQADWDEQTLERGGAGGQGFYTPRSDMYQIGVMLQRCLPELPLLSSLAGQFIQAVLDKQGNPQLTASLALQHPWLAAA